MKSGTYILSFLVYTYLLFACSNQNKESDARNIEEPCHRFPCVHGAVVRGDRSEGRNYRSFLQAATMPTVELTFKKR